MILIERYATPHWEGAIWQQGQMLYEARHAMRTTMNHIVVGTGIVHMEWYIITGNPPVQIEHPVAGQYMTGTVKEFRKWCGNPEAIFAQLIL